MNQTDPFTETLDAIWHALEAWQPLAELVRPVNRRKLPDLIDPYRQNVNTADLPEMVIEPAGGSVHLTFTSSTFQPVQNYTIQVATGQLSPRKLLAVKWAVICAIINANEDTNPFGLKYVFSVAVSDETEILDKNDTDQTEPGWSGRLTIQVTFNFNRDQMIAPN